MDRYTVTHTEEHHRQTAKVKKVDAILLKGWILFLLRYRCDEKF